MTDTVFCRKYQRDLPALETPPLPGPLGEKIQATVSRQAWQEWQHLQTMLINEKHLDLRDAEARKYLTEQRERFFDNEAFDHAEGYTPPPDPSA